MSYYILEEDMENEELDSLLAAKSSYLERIKVDFSIGEPLPIGDLLLPIDVFVMEVCLRGRFTDNMYLDEVDCYIFSDKAQKILQEERVPLTQLLPIKLIDEFSNADAVQEALMRDEKLDFERKVYEQYAILNVIEPVDCIDHTASKLEYFQMPLPISEDIPPEMRAMMQLEEDLDVDFIHRLVLDEERIPSDVKIFRLQNCPRILVFKKELVDAIRKAKLSGFVFVPLAEFTDAIPEDNDDDQEDTVPQESKTVKPKNEQPLADSQQKRKITIKKRKKP